MHLLKFIALGVPIGWALSSMAQTAMKWEVFSPWIIYLVIPLIIYLVIPLIIYLVIPLIVKNSPL